MNAMTIWGRGKERGIRSLASLVLVAIIGLVSPGLAWAQAAAAAGQQPGDKPCPGGIVGFLGITRIDCRGECTLTLDDMGQNRAWSFSVEPRITEIAPDSPAAHALQIGDRIVALDGALITTMGGGRRLANIEPDRDVTIRYRRDGRIGNAVLRAGTRCGPAVEGVSAIPPFAQPTPSDSASGHRVAWSGPGMLIQRWNTTDGPRTCITLPRASDRDEKTASRTAVGHVGMNFSCGPCSQTYQDGRTVYSFSNPIEVIGVEVGGPADRAGLRVGDKITAVDGMRIKSKEGGKAFSSLRPGQATRFTVIGRDGCERTMTVVPD